MIRTDITVSIGYTEEELWTAVCSHLPVSIEEISEIRLLKRTLDSSDKSNFRYKLTVALSLSPEREAGLLKMRKRVSPCQSLTLPELECSLPYSPVVVGSGPAGLFAALRLAESGASPIVLERGLSVDERVRKVKTFEKFSVLDPECNIQFGEGGAGTFSDGKLKVGSLDAYKYKVLSTFVSLGAPEEILYDSGAHLGTDKLALAVKCLRERIISLGGSFIFGARLTDITVSESRVTGVEYIKDGKHEKLDTGAVILATGHSARDVFDMLYKKGAPMEAKSFGIGVRLEHKREYIDELMHGKEPPKELGAASYHLVSHLDVGRSAYSFCMCPGGCVVAATSEEGCVVTNGMSLHARDGENSNAAILVSMTPADYPSNSPLAGIELQRMIERSAYSAGGSSYFAPVQKLSDFLEGRKTTALGSVKPSYPIGYELCEADRYLPRAVSETLRLAIRDFDAWLPGYLCPDAVMTGAETRSTSPVRILRSDSCESVSISGLYPAGEGAGYSGGIVSSAVDGIHCAEKLILNENSHRGERI
ncbi:MAG: FAD-binding protein [Clostridia bacterium]|nr:FAD-binding protein [Clostridia bacterium]